MKKKCSECGIHKAVVRDPRYPAIGVRLCAECGEEALIEKIEELQEVIDNLTDELKELNPNSRYF